MNVFEKAAEAARNAGAVYPEAVAEYIKDSLSVVNSLPGPTVMMRSGLEREPLDAAMVRLKMSETIAPLFTGEKLDVRKIDFDLYQAIRKHNPELLGLRRKRQFV